MKKIFIGLLIGLIVFAVGCSNDGLKTAPPPEEPQEETNTPEKQDEQNKEDKQMKWDSPPAMQIDTNKNYSATLDTNIGKIKIKLFAKDAPKTVNSFVFLSKEGFYDGVIFHRVIKDFMIQGGDPEGTGRGGPGYQFEDEINQMKLVKGKLAMANAGPNTNGSQFFIVTAQATPWLDGKHTAFGEVVEGMDIVDGIENSQIGPGDKPVSDITINKVTIEEK